MFTKLILSSIIGVLGINAQLPEIGIGESKLILPSATVNLSQDYVELPLYKGFVRSTGRSTDDNIIWHIITDTSSMRQSRKYQVVHSQKLHQLLGSDAVRQAEIVENVIVFDSGRVDFSPDRSLVTGEEPNLFPIQSTSPGAIGFDDYTPFVEIRNDGKRYVLNAETVANATESSLNSFCDGIPEELREQASRILNDQVVAICPSKGYVRIRAVEGYSEGRDIVYINTSSNSTLAAGLAGTTFVPRLSNVPLVVSEPLVAIGNGYANVDLNSNSPRQEHPQKQGVNSFLHGEGDPLNILGGFPTIDQRGRNVYSPLWEARIMVWSPEAVAENYRYNIRNLIEVRERLAEGLLLFNGVAPLYVNCPVVARLN